MDVSNFVHRIPSQITVHPDGTRTTATEEAVWTLVHKGYSGNGRLNVWVYPTEDAALLAGAQAAMDYGLDENPAAQIMLEDGDHRGLMNLYEATDPGALILRVQPAFLQVP